MNRRKLLTPSGETLMWVLALWLLISTSAAFAYKQMSDELAAALIEAQDEISLTLALMDSKCTN